MVIDKPSFQLTVSIESDLSEQNIQKLRSVLADSNSEEMLRKSELRSGVYWEIDFERADRPEILTQRMVNLGDKLAHTIAQITKNQGSTVGISLCQDVDDTEDPQQTGIWFSEDVVRWAALAGAMIGIDQYFYTD